MKTNLAKTPEITKLILADGKEYELALIDLNMLVAIEDTFDCAFADAFSSGKVKPLRFLLYLRLRDKYNLSLEDVGKLIDTSVMEKLGTVLES